MVQSPVHTCHVLEELEGAGALLPGLRAHGYLMTCAGRARLAAGALRWAPLLPAPKLAGPAMRRSPGVRRVWLVAHGEEEVVVTGLGCG